MNRLTDKELETMADIGVAIDEIIAYESCDTEILAEIATKFIGMVGKYGSLSDEDKVTLRQTYRLLNKIIERKIGE